MKTNVNKLFLTTAIVIILNFNNCKKYDDGPMFSLKSKTARLTGEWEVVEVSGQSMNDGEVIFEFEKDGDFSYTYDYGSYSYSYDGDWEWVDGKDAIEVEVDGEKMDFEIKRLTNKELWLEDEYNAEWELEKK